jgi:hypothetical protein
MTPSFALCAVSAVLVCATACSAAGGQSGPGTAQAKPNHGSTSALTSGPPAVIAPVSDLAGLCAKLGGNFTEETDQHELYTSDEGSCFGSRLYWFARTALRDQWLAQALQFGGNYVVGDRWAISVDDPAKAQFVAAETGGQVRS